MIRQLLPTAVSYKTRALLIDDQWVKVSKDFELNNVKIGQISSFTVAETVLGEPYIVSMEVSNVR